MAVEPERLVGSLGAPPGIKTGADVLVSTLADHGVKVTFGNPGTSEMHFVQALDREPRMRSVLCLFEGIVTGAADGYARVAGVPAMTLLHLGPGFANAGANNHNAKKGYVPVINVVGEHAMHHRHLDAPLTSDIETVVAPTNRWVGIVESAQEAGNKAAEAFRQAVSLPGGPVALLLPADSAWDQGGPNGPVKPAPARAQVDAARVKLVADEIRAANQAAATNGHANGNGHAAAAPTFDKAEILVNGPILETPEGLAILSRLEAGGVRVMIDTFITKIRRGGGVYNPAKLPYFAEQAIDAQNGVKLVVLAGTSQPVAFFAYPGKPSVLIPDGAKMISLSDRTEDTIKTLSDLADELGCPKQGPAPSPVSLPAEPPKGKLNPALCAVTIARHLPHNAVVCDDAVTSGAPIYALTATAQPHDWLNLTGGAIGSSIPMAVGASVAAGPDRKVLALSGDGAGMYTVQGLWTMARERLPVITVIFSNRSYLILNIEMDRTGAGRPSKQAAKMLSLDDPPIDWVSLAKGMGVDGARCETGEEFEAAFEKAVKMNAPFLIEAVI